MEKHKKYFAMRRIAEEVVKVVEPFAPLKNPFSVAQVSFCAQTGYYPFTLSNLTEVAPFLP